MDYDEARRQAMAVVDAFNRRDLHALQVLLHEEVTISRRSPIAVWARKMAALRASRPTASS